MTSPSASDPSVHRDENQSTTGVFGRVFDVVVMGSGYAGFAAAMALRARGRDVLLIGPRGDLVWESGRSFGAHAGSTDEPAWQRFRDQVAARGGASDDWLDGAICEMVATVELTRSGAHVLYYAQPVSIEKDPRP